MIEYAKLHGCDRVPFAVVIGNLMRFATECTGHVTNDTRGRMTLSFAQRMHWDLA
jgi:hypothetical protein